jgi:spore coat polysaccharide biosynthesis protein SpsF
MSDKRVSHTASDPCVVRAFVQARMSSSRYPGKVLAPFQGRPILWHVVERVAAAVPRERIVIATSTEPSDEPLAGYAETLGVHVFRGSLNNVFGRFAACLKKHPCDWFFRICADSPLLDGGIMRMMLPQADRPDVDLVTNILVRTFPHGHSVELIRARTFAGIKPSSLTPDEREHLTKVFYNHPQRFQIVNIESGEPQRAEQDLTVDTLDDLRRLEELAGQRETEA